MACIGQSSLGTFVKLHLLGGLSSTPQAKRVCVQVIPYITELLAKVHEQQVQAARITGFQAQFGYVDAMITTNAEVQPTCVM